MREEPAHRLAYRVGPRGVARARRLHVDSGEAARRRQRQLVDRHAFGAEAARIGVGLVARDRGEPALAGQILFSPMLDVCVATASLRDAHAGPVGCRWADGWHQYLPRASDALHPYATPGAAVRLAGLPRTLLVSAHDDPFRDETAAYAERLRAECVPVDTLMLPPPSGFPAAYMKAPACDAPWIAAVRARLERFLAHAHPTQAFPNQPRRISS